MDYLMLVDKFNPIDMGFYDHVELTEVNGKFMESQAGNRLRLLLKKAEIIFSFMPSASAFLSRSLSLFPA